MGFTRDEHIVLSWKPWLSQCWAIIYDVLDYRKYRLYACVRIISMREKKKTAYPRKKLGQLHTDTFLLLILSPSVPKTVKNEATKSRSGGKKRQISLIQSNPNSSPQPETWELFMEQETRVSVYWWSAKKKRPMWPEVKAQESPPGEVRVRSPPALFLPHSWHSALSAASPPPPWGIQQAVADISSSVWSLSNCLLLLSIHRFSYFMKQSKAATTALGSMTTSFLWLKCTQCLENVFM